MQYELLFAVCVILISWLQLARTVSTCRCALASWSACGPWAIQYPHFQVFNIFAARNGTEDFHEQTVPLFRV